ncbi:hypothetical protein HMPREF3208_00120 [Gardnerella vaginalis]|uniref:Uncharacterized protein n=1 Tax=Gardnerella vaginalis TaxID=2702 RepID=A0A133P306_GARVA|nr:hypothetical protein [Gardnerella vaginalis]KXA22890.1 hypothetical protein HMPREF3208_00120 [Gardnerella vaginalis]
MDELLIAIVVICVVVWVIIQVVNWIIHFLSQNPVIGQTTSLIIEIAILCALLIGFVIGVIGALKSYYKALIDVYGKNSGILISTISTIFWAACVLFITNPILQSLFTAIKLLLHHE